MQREHTSRSGPRQRNHCQVGFRSFSNGKMVYSYYSDWDHRRRRKPYVSKRMICDTGYAQYRSTDVYDKEKHQDVFEKYVLTYTCDKGGWVGEEDDRITSSIHDSCSKESLVDGLLAEPPKPTKEVDPPRKLTLADSVAGRIEGFYDKSKHLEQVLLKRLFKKLATEFGS